MSNTSKAVQEQFEMARRIFDAQVVSGDLLMCKINQHYAGPGNASHICLGCNLAAITLQLSKFLRIAAENRMEFEPHELVSMFAFQVNALFERLDDVITMLGVPMSYRCRHYRAFLRMRPWANFFKHPKEFGWLVHHPTYYTEQTREAVDLVGQKGIKVIDDEFLAKYYSAERCKGLAGEFKDFPTAVVVLLPHTGNVTEGICESLANFVDLVTQNPVYVELLTEKATIINYFERAETTVTTTQTTTTTTTLPPEVDACAS